MSYSPRAIALLCSAILFGSLYYRAFPSTAPKTYCYAGITTLSSSPSEPHESNCFTVSASGVFSRVFTSSTAEKIDPGHVLPGLWDGHGHLLPYGEFLSGVDLFGSSSLEDAKRRIRNYVYDNPQAGSPGEWIRGVGWDQAAFNGQMPTAVCTRDYLFSSAEPSN